MTMPRDFLSMDTAQRRRFFQERDDAINSLSAEAEAVFKTARDWGTSVSPELAEAMAKAVLEAAKPKP